MVHFGQNHVFDPFWGPKLALFWSKIQTRPAGSEKYSDRPKMSNIAIFPNVGCVHKTVVWSHSGGLDPNNSE